MLRRVPGERHSPSESCASTQDRKSTRLNSSHLGISYAVFCLKKKKKRRIRRTEHRSAPGRIRSVHDVARKLDAYNRRRAVVSDIHRARAQTYAQPAAWSVTAL